MLVENCDAATCTTNCMLRAHMQGQLVPLIFPAWACKCQEVLAKALPIPACSLCLCRDPLNVTVMMS